MKKIPLLVLFAFLGTFAQSQIYSHALGARFNGDGSRNGAEVSYQQRITGTNRLEVDLGWRTHPDWHKMALTGIYHWYWNIDGGLNWYAGPGAQMAFYSGKRNRDDDGASISLGGQVGIEYNFNQMGAPILLSLDWRPMWDFVGSYSGFGYGIGLGLRYTWE